MFTLNYWVYHYYYYYYYRYFYYYYYYHNHCEGLRGRAMKVGWAEVGGGALGM